MKFKQVLILYHIKEREQMICEMMAETLRTHGLAEEVIIEKEYDAIAHIYDYEPDLIISQQPRDQYSTALFTMVKLAFQCCWVAVPTEGLVNLASEEIRILVGYNKQPLHLIDAYWFWGPGMAEAAGKELLRQEKIASRDRIRVFGYLPYEKELIRRFRKHTPAEDELREKKQGFKRTVMIVTGRMAIPLDLNRLKDENRIDPADSGAREKEIRRIEADEAFTDRYVSMIKALASENPEVLFAVKLHPIDMELIRGSEHTRYELLKSLSNILFIDGYAQISSFFEDVELLIHYGSTTSLEAYVYEVPTIGIRNDDPEAPDNSLGVTNFFAQEICTPEEIGKIGTLIREGVTFQRYPAAEEALFQYMNYTGGKPYRPSELMANLAASLGEPLHLSRDQKYVKEQLRYKAVIKKRVQFLVRKWKSRLTGDRETATRITTWGRKYRKS